MEAGSKGSLKHLNISAFPTSLLPDGIFQSLSLVPGWLSHDPGRPDLPVRRHNFVPFHALLSDKQSFHPMLLPEPVLHLFILFFSAQKIN